MADILNVTPIYVGTPISGGDALLASIYGAVFGLGVLGNLWVARVLLNVLIYGRADTVPQSILIFILALCASDLVVLSSLLLMLVDLILGQWVLGRVLCLSFVTMDMVNKFFTPFLLAILSATCYVAICRPNPCFLQTNRMRQPPFAIKALVITFLASLVVGTPAFFYAEMIVFAQRPTLTEKGYLLPVMRKCGFYPPPNMTLVFTIYGTILGYVLPLALFCFFYAKVALYVRHHNRATMRKVPIRVGKMIFALLSVYVSSWSPFWIGAWVVCLVKKPSDTTVMIVNLTHLLPYISCIIYPAIYTRMNSGIQAEHARLLELHRQRKLSNQSRFSWNSLRSVRSSIESRRLEITSTSSRRTQSVRKQNTIKSEPSIRSNRSSVESYASTNLQVRRLSRSFDDLRNCVKDEPVEMTYIRGRVVSACNNNNKRRLKDLRELSSMISKKTNLLRSSHPRLVPPTIDVMDLSSPDPEHPEEYDMYLVHSSTPML